MAAERGRSSHAWLLVALAFGCLALVVLFVTVGAGVMAGVVEPLNQAVRDAALGDRTAFITTLSTVVSFVGDKLPLTVLCIAAGWWVLPHRAWWIPLLVGCAVAVTVLVDWLKATYGVVRPEGGLLTSSSHSFPSGHASGTAAIALFVAFVAVRERVHGRWIAPAAVALTVLVGISRIYLDEHWSSDVVGGWMVGSAIAASFAAAYEFLRRYHRTA